MSLFDDSNENRTERPTDCRRRQARDRGLVARSTELLTAARLLSIWIILGWWFVSFANLAGSWMQTTFQQAGKTPSSAAALSELREQSWRFFATASWPLLTATSAILLAHVVQVGWLWRWNNMAPQATRLSPLSGLQRLLSSATVGHVLRILLKLTIVLGVSAMVLMHFLPIAASSSTAEFPGQFTGLASSAVQLTLRVAFALAAFGMMDYGWQRWRFERSLQMTREEVREELKEVEGDPRLKSQRHAIAHQLSHSGSANSALETNTDHSL